ncbi:MAG: tyrosine-type recombinase/integrase [Alphaproteobacteria bacterium]|nr:tyrosine-type recombinase/integrase [Alphaproteobacteria bacterium]
MPALKFTDRNVASIKPPDTDRLEYRDTGVPGLWLRVSDHGRKSWGVTYRLNGRQRRLTIGTYPTLSLADARDNARKVLREVGIGNDPAEEKQQQRKGATFGLVAEQYMREHAMPNKKSWRGDRGALDRDLLPAFSNRKVSDIKRGEVIAMLQSIKDRGAPITANRTLEIVRKIYNWALAREIVEHNPCAGIEKLAKEQQRDRVLSSKEITDLWHALDGEPLRIAARYKLMLITAQRGGEVRQMRWQDIDLDEGWWTVPSEFSKNSLSHRVPLSDLAIDLLRQVQAEAADRTADASDGTPEVLDGAWMFPSPTAEGPVRSNTKANARLRRNSGVEFRPHDLRRTAASKMAGELGVDRLTLAKILNHVDTGVTAVYDRHGYDKEKREALVKWAGHLEIITGDADNVVRLRKDA